MIAESTTSRFGDIFHFGIAVEKSFFADFLKKKELNIEFGKLGFEKSW